MTRDSKNNFSQKMRRVRKWWTSLQTEFTTPVENDAAPLNPIYTQQSQQDEDLDLQPSRGPREETLVNVLDQYLGDNYKDVVRTSNIQTNFSISTTARDITGWLTLPLGWIVPDGTNRTLEEISDKKISNGSSPGGGQAGAVVVSLQRLKPYCGTPFFLVDLETGEVFGYLQQQWRRAGLYCSSQPFAINELMLKVEWHGQAMQAELEAEQQTPLMELGRTPGQFEVPPPLPAMDEPDVYILHPDTMETNTRKNYVCDRMQATLIYISEYAETRRMMTENRYRNEDLMVCLRAIFGRVDRIRNQIDLALQQDDAHRRKRHMWFLLLPSRFPSPESMGQGNITVWTNWIREENDVVMNQLEEELEARGDPDYPFNGSANGVYQPLHENYLLPPPVQTPRRQDSNSKHSESSRNSWINKQRSEVTDTNTKQDKMNPQMQAVPRESGEHSLESLDPMRSIRNLHIQQEQNRVHNEVTNQKPTGLDIEVNPLPQEYNLIMFTPPHGRTAPLGATVNQGEPKKQRMPRKRKTKNEWQLNQRQLEQNKSQEISHISPNEQGKIFNTKEPSVSHLQLPIKKNQEDRRCSRCGETGHWRHFCQATTWCRFCMSETHATQACRKYTNFVRDNPIASSRRTTPVQEQKRSVQPEPLQVPQQYQQVVVQKQPFPQPLTQWFQAPVIPPVETRNIQ